MINYANSKIFILRTPHNNQVYYGASTSEHLYIILSQHKNLYTQYKEGKQHFREYFKLFELGENDVTIELVEKASCNNRQELKKRIKHFINNTCINNKKITNIMIDKPSEEQVDDSEEDEEPKEPKMRTRTMFSTCKGCGDSYRTAWMHQHIKCQKHLDIVAGIRERDVPSLSFSLE
jgi:hypothetical protein